MGFDYDWWFSFPPPDLQQVLQQVDDEYLAELAIEDEKWLSFYQNENEGTFYLYYNEPDELYPGREETLLLSLTLTSTVREGNRELPVGVLDVRYAWSVEVGKSNHAKASEVYTRLLRTVLQCYVGDMATLFQAESLELCRLGERVYLDQSSEMTSEPLLSLLELSPGYEVGDYPCI